MTAKLSPAMLERLRMIARHEERYRNRDHNYYVIDPAQVQIKALMRRGLIENMHTSGGGAFRLTDSGKQALAIADREREIAQQAFFAWEWLTALRNVAGSTQWLDEAIKRCKELAGVDYEHRD
jgi:hypothetical protein